MTTYRVFVHTDEGAWGDVGDHEGRSAKEAIRLYLNGTKDEIGDTYAAVPARSWQPVKVQVETALKFS